MSDIIAFVSEAAEHLNQSLRAARARPYLISACQSTIQEVERCLWDLTSILSTLDDPPWNYKYIPPLKDAVKEYRRNIFPRVFARDIRDQAVWFVECVRGFIPPESPHVLVEWARAVVGAGAERKQALTDKLHPEEEEEEWFGVVAFGGYASSTSDSSIHRYSVSKAFADKSNNLSSLQSDDGKHRDRLATIHAIGLIDIDPFSSRLPPTGNLTARVLRLIDITINTPRQVNNLKEALISHYIWSLPSPTHDRPSGNVASFGERISQTLPGAKILNMNLPEAVDQSRHGRDVEGSEDLGGGSVMSAPIERGRFRGGGSVVESLDGSVRNIQGPSGASGRPLNRRRMSLIISGEENSIFSGGTGVGQGRKPGIRDVYRTIGLDDADKSNGGRRVRSWDVISEISVLS